MFRTSFLTLAATVAVLSCSAFAARPAHPAAAKTAHSAPPAVPRSIGKFDDWTAATHQEAGQTVCYAFTRAATSSPALPGRGDVVLTVTQRPGGTRDAVAISAGFAYAANAQVQVQIEQTLIEFYTAQRSAFAPDGHAAVSALERGNKAVAKSPARSATVTDTFSLRGFSPAYAAINKADQFMRVGLRIVDAAQHDVFECDPSCIGGTRIAAAGGDQLGDRVFAVQRHQYVAQIVPHSM